VELLEAGELWAGLDNESFMKSFRKRGVGWQGLGVLQLGPGHVRGKDRRTWKIVMWVGLEISALTQERGRAGARAGAGK